MVSLRVGGSQWDETGKREERKKSSCCCCSPALRAEIRLINSRDNVEMSSMTSILGAEAQQHHCAALQHRPVLSKQWLPREKGSH